MEWIVERVRTRLLPALLTAMGITLIAAGILTLDGPVEAGGTLLGSVAPSSSPVQTPPGPSASADPSTAPPSTSPSASATATASPGPDAATRVATRVLIPALGIDLPVVTPPGDASTYPLCDVAMYIKELVQPGQPGATYLYAHARTGMFLPLLENSRVNDGAAMIGMLVQVYTSDDRLYLYEITQVRRHALTLDDALAAKTPQLWLQTSEGPKGTPQKLQVVAMPLSDGPADHAAAHPTPRPVVCG